MKRMRILGSILALLVIFFSCEMADTRQQEEETGTISFQVALPQSMAAENSNARFLLAETSAVEVLVLPAATFDNPLYSGLGTAPPTQTLVEGLRLLDGALSTVIRPAAYTTDADGVISAAHSFQLPPGDYRVIVGSFVSVGTTDLPDWSQARGSFIGPVTYGSSAVVTVESNQRSNAPITLDLNWSNYRGTGSGSDGIMDLSVDNVETIIGTTNNMEPVGIALTGFQVGTNYIKPEFGYGIVETDVNIKAYDLLGNSIPTQIFNDPDLGNLIQIDNLQVSDTLLFMVSPNAPLAINRALYLELEKETSSMTGHVANLTTSSTTVSPNDLTVTIDNILLSDTEKIEIFLYRVVNSNDPVSLSATAGIPFESSFVDWDLRSTGLNNQWAVLNYDPLNPSISHTFQNIDPEGDWRLVAGAFDAGEATEWFYMIPTGEMFYGPTTFVTESLTLSPSVTTHTASLMLNYQKCFKEYGFAPSTGWGSGATPIQYFDMKADNYDSNMIGNVQFNNGGSPVKGTLFLVLGNLDPGDHNLSLSFPSTDVNFSNFELRCFTSDGMDYPTYNYTAPDDAGSGGSLTFTSTTEYSILVISAFIDDTHILSFPNDRFLTINYNLMSYTTMSTPPYDAGSIYFGIYNNF